MSDYDDDIEYYETHMQESVLKEHQAETFDRMFVIHGETSFQEALLLMSQNPKYFDDKNVRRFLKLARTRG